MRSEVLLARAARDVDELALVELGRPKTVATFLRSSSIGQHIVFSTYQSAHVLAEALARSRFSTAPMREDPLDDLRFRHAGDQL